MTDTKVCPTCKREFHRKPGVAPSLFARRQYCSRECYRNDPQLKDPRSHARLVNYDAKTCEVCGARYERPANQRGQTWAARRVCSPRCRDELRHREAWAKLPVRACAICGAEYRSRVPQQSTCLSDECKRRYKMEIAVPKTAAALRLAHAEGRLAKARGIPQHERLLWPFLEPHGWAWRMRWTDSWGTFELDFADLARKVNVEIDGENHRWPKQRKKDETRDAELERRGWRVVRILNSEVDADLQGVAKRILALAA